MPDGAPGLLTWHYFGWSVLDRSAPDIGDVLSRHHDGREWLIDIWEPLHTKAPAPPKAAPFCCYSQTVIFYHSPYIVWPWGGWWKDQGGNVRAPQHGSGYLQWDQIDTRIGWHDRFTRGISPDVFEVGGGRVFWCRGRWWMYRQLRRQQQRQAAA
jgi:hypothetical protein